MSYELARCENLKKYYSLSRGIFRSGKLFIKALDGVDLRIFKGEIVGLVGESGCGKSTLARLLVGLEDPTEGAVFFENRNIREFAREELKTFRRKVQIIFQDPYASLNPRQPVGKAIEEGLVIHKIGNKKEREEKVREIMSVVGLNPKHFSFYPHEFSGGQRQRICIARALVLEPELVICDEPLSALDVSIQAQIINLLLDLRESYDLSYVMITHDLSVVRYMADRIAVMYLGQVVESASKEELFSEQLHPYTKALFQAVPSTHPKLRKKREIIGGEPPSPFNPHEGCSFRSRCPYRFERCMEEKPPLKEVAKDWFVRCFIY